MCTVKNIPLPDLSELIFNIQNYSSQVSNDSGHVSPTNNSDNEIDEAEDDDMHECEEKIDQI